MSFSFASKKNIARHVANAFGGQPTVNRYSSEKGDSSIDLVSCKKSPRQNLTSYATVGLSDYPVTVSNKHVHTEILGVFETSKEEFGNALASAAFFSIREGWQCVYGSVLQNALDMYSVSESLKHFFFVSPFLWDSLSPLKIDSVNIHWLLAVPINDSEYLYWKKFGADALESRLEDKNIDIFDLER